ncbi:hypothetical protein ACFU99_10530, partial [Streptomyces sp. NPDC057654]
ARGAGADLLVTRARPVRRNCFSGGDTPPVSAPLLSERCAQPGVLGWLEHFRLGFGAFDFAVTPCGDWVMFECNPSGEWSWIQNRTGLPIAGRLAGLLAEERA